MLTVSEDLLEVFDSFTKGFNPNQPRDRLGRWWDGVPRAYGVYDTNSSGRATGNDIETRGHGRRRPGASRVTSTTAGVTNMPGRANKRQQNRGSEWVSRNLVGSERNYGNKVIEHASRGKNIPVATREAFVTRNKVPRERLFDIENSLIDVMFRTIEKSYISFTKHGTHDQSTHGNRYGGAAWGYSRGGSSHITGNSAKYMGLSGYRVVDTGDQEFDSLSRRSALGMLKAIHAAKPRNRPLFHGEVASDDRISSFQKGVKVSLPLTATSNSEIMPEGYARKSIGQVGHQLMIEFEPGVKSLKYQSGEWITAGDFEVVDVRKYDKDFTNSFDYQEQRRADYPVTHVILRQIGTFDPTGVSKAKNPLWDGDGVQGVGQPRGYHGRWTDTGGGAVAARVARARPSASVGSSLWDHKNKTLSSNAKLTRLPHGGQHAIEVNGKKVARKNYTPEQALYLRNNGPTKITNTRLAEIHKDRSKITPAERDLLMSAGAQAAIDGDDDVKVWVVRDKAYKPRPRYSIIANLRKEIANDVARQSGDRGEGSTQHVTRRSDRTAAQREQENKKRVESGRNAYARIRKDMVTQFSSDGGKTVRCIFCGKPVAASVASPERMKPGPIGGKYEIGNVAPAHERCNTVAGQVAQYDPERYYDEMMAKFMEMYIKMNPEQKKRMQPIFTKNRKKLGARPR